MKKLLLASILLVVVLSTSTLICQAAEQVNLAKLNVEELRVDKALKQIPEVASMFSSRLNRFSKLIESVNTYDGASRLIAHEGNQLWLAAITDYAKRKDLDDRPLYWARLQFNRIIKKANFFSQLSDKEQQQLLWISELASRGNSDIQFDKKTQFKILLTGFDPFFLDRNIEQSNPSGVIATAFDDKVLFVGGYALEIETVIVPVRYADFDQGMIETILTPRIKNKSIDMIATVSMGRDDFDLERYPGLRRSAKAPDNLNVYTGASATNPLIPMLNDKPLQGPEFNVFSLRADVMKQAQGAFKVIDNHQVTTSEKTFEPKSLKELKGTISVQGSGGGYLSNEISYRSLLLRDKYQPDLPVGHIHTPRYQGVKPEKVEKIIAQVEQMLLKALEKMAEVEKD
jgi:pyrrolidone-carboxylate peptidase